MRGFDPHIKKNIYVIERLVVFFLSLGVAVYYKNNMNNLVNTHSTVSLELGDPK